MRRYIVRLLLTFSDVISLLFSFYLSFVLKNDFLYFTDNNRPGYFNEHWTLVLYSVAIWITVLAFDGDYSLEEKDAGSKFIGITRAGIGSFFILIVFLFAAKISADYSRIIIFSFFVFSIVLTPLIRYFTERVLKKIGLFQRPTIIVGLKEDFEYFKKNFNRQFYYYNKIKKTYIFDSAREIIKNLDSISPEGEQVFILSRKLKLPYIVKIIRYFEGRVYYIKLLPDLGEFDLANMDIYQLDGNLLLQSRQNLFSPARKITKRIFDIIVSIFGLIVLSPLFILISLMIKMTSKGPIFFGHKRLGKDGKIFRCWKFRTMVLNAEEILQKWLEERPEIKAEFEKDFKLKDDPRITKIGNFLRKTSLDELPQLWNVVIGNMSLVGPRPVVEKEIEKYGEYGPVMLRALPGVTGMWQTSGRNDIDYKDRIELDMYYIKNWSVWLDIVVILKTIPAVLKRKGAY